MRAHALLSASGSSRWLNCTASARLEEGIPDKGSFYAYEGTLAHEIGEAILLDDTGALDRHTKHELFYEGMINEVEIYTSYCQERLNELVTKDPTGADMYVEERLSLNKYIPNGFGTCDCILVGGDSIEIVDLKFGKGVPVDVENNSQLMLYALGALDFLDYLYDFKTVRMTIAQVRTLGITSFDMTVKDLRQWAEEVVKPKAVEADKGGTTPVPGDWCTFCKFRNRCKPRADRLQSIVDRYKGKDSLSEEDIANILSNAKSIEKWIKDIKDYALEEAMNGVQFPGWKLVEGRSNRRIADEVGLVNTLLQEGYEEQELYKPKELNNLTTLEKLVGAKKFSEIGDPYLIKPTGAPTLVVESDKRPALYSAEDDFEFK